MNMSAFCRPLCGFILLLPLLGCGAIGETGRVTPTPTREIRLGELHFESPETARRLTALDQCVREMADTSWRHIPYEGYGNFLEARWCRGNGAGAPGFCSVDQRFVNELDQHAIELYTLSYATDYSEVFGLGVRALWVPPTPGWGVVFYFAEDGKTVVGEGFDMDFLLYRGQEGRPEKELHLGGDYEYSLEETVIRLPADLPLREDLSLYITSPEGMRDRGLKQMDALLAKVEERIRAHQVPKCEYGPYQGGGIPPQCAPRPMTREEEEQELAAAKSYFASREQWLRDDYREMYQALISAFPLDRCWP